MEIKIKGRTPEQLQRNIDRIITMASVICQGGYLPTEEEQTEVNLGRKPYLDEDNSRYHLFPMANNDWANIRKRGEDFVVLEFNHRYDKGYKKKEALTNLIIAWFEEAELMTYHFEHSIPIKEANQ